MRRLAVVALFAAFAVVASFAGFQSAVAQGPGGSGGPGGMRQGGMNPFPPDSFSSDRDSLVKITMERIAGQEKDPADKVFKNLKVPTHGRTAEQFLRGMNGLGRSLGVPCSHCHIENHWADDDKPTKQIARNMMRMTAAINDSIIPEYQWPHDDKPHVGCFTCHKGHANPNFGMPQRQGGQGGQGRPEAQGRPGGEQH